MRAPFARLSRTPIRFAVIGMGYWGPNFVRNLYTLPNVEVGLICDARAEALDRIAARHPGIPVTPSFDDVLEDDSIDAVIIATPISTHASMARRVLEAGKHVLVEKPLAHSSEGALDLIRLSEEQGLVLMPGHTFIYSPAVNMIRSLIQSGALGEVYFVSMSRVNLGLHQGDASVIWDLGPHDFSILEYWLGAVPSYVTALSRDCLGFGSPDIAFVSMVYPAQTIAHVELSWLAPSKLRRTTIVGSKKMVVYDDTSNEPVRIFDSGACLPEPGSFGEFQMTYRTGDIVSPRVELHEPLHLELEDFCTAIRTGSTPRSNAQLGLDVVRVIEAAHDSLALMGGPATVGEPQSTLIR